MKKLFFLGIALLMLSCAFVSCNNGGSNSVYGVWKEYRADDPSDDYLISQLRFNENGTGSFVLLDGSDVRNKFEFTWTMDAYGVITTRSFNGSSTYYFNNGLITEESAFGTIVYKKKGIF